MKKGWTRPDGRIHPSALSQMSLRVFAGPLSAVRDGRGRDVRGPDSRCDTGHGRDPASTAAHTVSSIDTPERGSIAAPGSSPESDNTAGKHGSTGAGYEYTGAPRVMPTCTSAFAFRGAATVSIAASATIDKPSFL